MSASSDNGGIKKRDLSRLFQKSVRRVETMNYWKTFKKEMIDNETNKVVGGGSFSAILTDEEKKKERNDVTCYSKFLFDMDGVLQRCGVAIEGAGEFLLFLRDSKIPFILLTNECRFTNQHLSEHLEKLLSIKIDPCDIFTAANSARDFFLRLIRHNFYSSAFVIGESGLISNLQEAYQNIDQNKGKSNLNAKVFTGENFKDFDEKIHEPVRYVIVGSVWNENTRNVEFAAQCIKKYGARLIYTCPDWYDCYDDGRYAFGMPMTTVSLFEKVLKCSSYGVGKPNAVMVRQAVNLLQKKSPNLKWKEILFVGDSLNTDIRTSMENGIDSALVLSGTTNKEKLAQSAILPTYVFKSVADIHQQFKKKQNSN